MEWISVVWDTDADGYVSPYETEHNERLYELLQTAGIQWRLKSGKKRLIGELNQSLGSCGCCEFTDWDEIEAYRVLVPAEEL